MEDACRREVSEETGLAIKRLTLVGVYSKPGRDPRGPTCTVAFLARVRGARRAPSPATTPRRPKPGCRPAPPAARLRPPRHPPRCHETRCNTGGATAAAQANPCSARASADTTLCGRARASRLAKQAAPPEPRGVSETRRHGAATTGMSGNLIDLITSAAAIYGERALLRCDGVGLGARDLLARTAGLAHGFDGSACNLAAASCCSRSRRNGRSRSSRGSRPTRSWCRSIRRSRPLRSATSSTTASRTWWSPRRIWRPCSLRRRTRSGAS